MNETSRHSTPLISRDTPSATSSPELVAGASPSDSPDGPMTDLFGRAVVLVSPSVRRVPILAAPIPAIFGQRGIASSASAALQSSLVSRLRQRLDTDGSTLFVTTWNEKATPSGRSVCLLVHSGPRMSGNGFGGLPTPTASDYRDRGNVNNPVVARRRRLGKQINLGMLFKGTPCPSCVSAMMGYPLNWHRVFCAALVTPSSRKSRQRLSPPIKR